MKKIMCAGVCVALVLGASASRGEPGAATNRTEITAGTLTFDYQRRVAVFDRDVVVVDPAVRMESDRLTMTFDEAQQPENATAVGNVKITEGDRVATADRAVYDVKSGQLVLNGRAVLRRGRETVSGNKIVFSRNDNVVTCSPVNMVLYPSEGQGLGKGLTGIGRE